MTQTVRAGFVAVFAAAAALSLTRPGEAAQRNPSPSSGQTRPAGQTQAESAPPSADASDTRKRLMAVLERHPPSVGHVLKLDPSLMRNDAFLSSYPSLKEFLAQHPEIPQNASYYLQQIYAGYARNPEQERLQMLGAVAAGFAAFIVFIILLATMAWVIRTILNQRRWNRLSKIQAEVHTKLMDRFSSNEELLAYVQTPPGRRFLESGPSPLPEASRAIGAPLTRILWSVQAGVVLTIVGVGLLYVSESMFYEASQTFFVLGVLSLAAGAGFVVSAVAAYALSRRLGLLDRPASDHA
jgi:hypothetical protein